MIRNSKESWYLISEYTENGVFYKLTLAGSLKEEMKEPTDVIKALNSYGICLKVATPTKKKFAIYNHGRRDENKFYERCTFDVIRKMELGGWKSDQIKTVQNATLHFMNDLEDYLKRLNNGSVQTV